MFSHVPRRWSQWCCMTGCVSYIANNKGGVPLVLTMPSEECHGSLGTSDLVFNIDNIIIPPGTNDPATNSPTPVQLNEDWRWTGDEAFAHNTQAIRVLADPAFPDPEWHHFGGDNPNQWFAHPHPHVLSHWRVYLRKSTSVLLNEVEMFDMQSNVTLRLFMCREVLGVDDITGGFNFMGWWSTGS